MKALQVDTRFSSTGKLNSVTVSYFKRVNKVVNMHHSNNSFLKPSYMVGAWRIKEQQQ